MIDQESVKKKTLVLGASLKEKRYSNKAIKMLRKYGHEVIALGLRKGLVEDVEIITNRDKIEDLDTITMYLNAKNQESYLEYIIGLKPNRIIFNPGAENAKLVSLAKEHNIISTIACTLVLLSTGQF